MQNQSAVSDDNGEWFEIYNLAPLTSTLMVSMLGMHPPLNLQSVVLFFCLKVAIWFLASKVILP